MRIKVYFADKINISLQFTTLLNSSTVYLYIVVNSCVAAKYIHGNMHKLEYINSPVSFIFCILGNSQIAQFSFSSLLEQMWNKPPNNTI